MFVICRVLFLITIVSSSFSVFSDPLIPIDHSIELKKKNWSFDGMLGKFDRASIKRGYEVYSRVCSSCHGLKRVTYADLESIGYSQEAIKEMIAVYSKETIDEKTGEVVRTTPLLTDSFIEPYKNEEQAKSFNNGIIPPDLSLMVKARKDGANYIYSLLVGYGKEGEKGYKKPPLDYLHYNPYFIGDFIGMVPPLISDIISYDDGETEATVENMASDVVNFLQWAAEPEMEERKSLGWKVLIFTFIVMVMLFLLKADICSSIYNKVVNSKDD